VTDLTLTDHLKPGIEAGVYTIEAEHAVAGVKEAPAPSASRTFTVQGPRFTLDPTDVHALYPPADAAGRFGDTLPHVALATRTLPWERARVEAAPDTVPWLALLVLDAAEPGAATAMTVEALLKSAGDVHVPQLKTVSDVESKMTCQTLELPLALFQAVVPRRAELPLLAHTRDVDTSAQAGDGDSGQFALVVANRFPAAAAGGTRNVAHLVSLEGHDALLDATPGGPDRVRLVSLLSWGFTATPDADDAGETFAQLAAGVARPRAGERQDLALGLPFDEAASRHAPSPPPPADPNRRVADRLADGYVPVAYHLPTGQDTVAWYRGPFTPQPDAPVKDAARPFPTASAGLVYDAETGIFDVSLATAWSVGRAMALADRAFTVELIRFRRGAHRLVDLVLAGLESVHLVNPPNLEAIAREGLIEQRFLERLQADLAAHVAGVSSGKTAPATGLAPGAAALPADPVDAVKALLERDDLQTLVTDEVTGDLGPIAGWLARLMLLENVPFAYLVPHPELLPIESARFFEVDGNWVGALVDGALSAGVQSSRDSWFQRVVQQIAPDAALRRLGAGAGRMSGLLVRSALVSGWPGLTVEATANGAPTPLLRSELMAPSVLLCLFDGVPDTVRLRSPHQTLHFGTEGGVVHPRKLDGTRTGAPITVVPDLYRPGDRRVLDLAGGLVSRLATEVGEPVGSAVLALQMLAVPEEVSFTR